MSNSLAIAAVTATLRRLLAAGLDAYIPNGDRVTVKTLDKARDDKTDNQVNVYLYNTVSNPGFTNMDMPGKVKSGETAIPPLALNLFYLITAYGENDDERISHCLLGKAMSVLHDHPVLGREEIKDALADNDLHQQVERVRITPQPLTLDEVSKLWTAFQTQYRISAAYQVSVVLIDSTQPAKTPLPVLTRGKDDAGISAEPDLIPPFPTIESVAPPKSQLSVRPGEDVTVRGHHLEGDEVSIRLVNPRLKDPANPSSEDFRIIGPVPDATAARIKFAFPDQSEQWPAGFYRISALIKRASDQDRTSNEKGLSVAPSMQSITPNPANRDPDGHVTLTVTCKPHLLPDQAASLLLGDREIRASAHPAKTNTVTFVVKDAPIGEHFVRLRVDGVDSILIDREATPPRFDDTQKVTISP
ncbi:MAG: Pvc16 family protein [Planctomycetota bacterium]|jgi:hypothetical protein